MGVVCFWESLNWAMLCCYNYNNISIYLQFNMKKIDTESTDTNQTHFLMRNFYIHNKITSFLWFNNYCSYYVFKRILHSVNPNHFWGYFSKSTHTDTQIYIYNLSFGSFSENLIIHSRITFDSICEFLWWAWGIYNHK